ncbi:MAG TPA: tetratricopeptide repeat protein, partial [Chitinispirillaceae bacterium]|nr:tetratricopeptide repeat protein [Chitinispirillaceae bacterium]
AETNSSEMTDPFENPSLEPQQSSIETDEPCSLENTVNSDSTSDFADSDQDEMCDIISGEDVKDRLDQFFPSDNLISNSSAGMIPPDNNESEDDLSDFYTIFGDSAENGQPVDDLSGLEQIEMEIPSETETPVSFYDEWNDVCSMQDQNESEEKGPKEKILKTDIQSKKTIPETNSQSDEQQNQSRPYTIPDHVLTPTLADIYFQQGQSDLAIQIYTRLLSRDPENENLQQRLQQVKMTAETGVFNSDYKVVTDDSQKTVSENSAAKKKKIVVDNRPLAGVRIKKTEN